MDTSSSLDWHEEQDREGLLQRGEGSRCRAHGGREILAEIEIDLTFARHANRRQLRQSSERLESIRLHPRWRVPSSPVGAWHASVLGKVVLAAATMSMLPFVDGAGRLAGRRYRTSYEHAMRNLERVHQYAEAAQSETRKDLRLQIAALFGQLDGLAAEFGVDMAERLGLGQVREHAGASPSAAFDGLRQAIEKIPLDATQTPRTKSPDPTAGPASDLAETLALIEYRIVEVLHS